LISIIDSYQGDDVNKAKLFWTGRSQAVRLPKEYRFEGNEVRIRRQGDAVVLEPITRNTTDDWAWLDEIAGKLGGNFMPDGREQPEMQERPELHKLFK
jgi:antitoxin VapB